MDSHDSKPSKKCETIHGWFVEKSWIRIRLIAALKCKMLKSTIAMTANLESSVSSSLS